MSDLKKRIVVKVGTSSLTHEGGTLNFRSLDKLAMVLSDIQNMGNEVVLVTSGAIGVGLNKLHMSERPTEVSLKQAAAAVGQCELMHIYDKFFGEYGKTVAQILLTGDDTENPDMRLSLENIFNSLMNLGVIPIVNENDSVSYSEIESDGHDEHKVFGDNDTLSATVAVLCGADTLVLLSDIDGLYDSNPNDNPDALLIREVSVIDDDIRALAGGAGTSRGTGGMITKIKAAEFATENGIDMFITNGQSLENLYSIVQGESVGTKFVGRKRKND